MALLTDLLLDARIRRLEAQRDHWLAQIAALKDSQADLLAFCRTEAERCITKIVKLKSKQT